MFPPPPISNRDKPSLYAELCAQVRTLLADESDLIANASNFAALVFDALPDVNWAGFYLFDGTELVVGPFQGKPACVRIPLGRGVCGMAAQYRETQLVEDVHTFADHIACDATSRSEIVVPLLRADATLLGVWDVDSPLPARFDADDCAGMEALCATFMHSVED
ncbi:MAG: GAF domain-containing protein [Acidihalobacter sp.]|uniref:GAF domain-containing protein n=1 Tax=Acidihalobacter sp. TaxID=1872108 RepID=UPI00307FC6F2